VADVAGVGTVQDRVVRRVVLDAATIRDRIQVLGEQIANAYPEGELLLLAPLKGSFMFAADLVRAIRRPLRLDFLVAPPAAGFSPAPSGSTALLYDPETNLRGKHVLLLVDIIDSGFTASRLMTMLGTRAPRSLEMCALLHKRVATGLKWPARFVGFDVPPEFLVGYGLENAEHFRHLPYIVSLE
jgi:hypoxanthine phosphoribosyltransferase